MFHWPRRQREQPSQHESAPPELLSSDIKISYALWLRKASVPLAPPLTLQAGQCAARSGSGSAGCAAGRRWRRQARAGPCEQGRAEGPLAWLPTVAVAAVAAATRARSVCARQTLCVPLALRTCLSSYCTGCAPTRARSDRASRAHCVHLALASASPVAAEGGQRQAAFAQGERVA